MEVICGEGITYRGITNAKTVLSRKGKEASVNKKEASVNKKEKNFSVAVR